MGEDRFVLRFRALLLALGVLVAVCGGVIEWGLDHRNFETTSRVIELGIMAAGLISLGFISLQVRLSADQAKLTADQIHQTAVWNKLLSYHQFFGELLSEPLLVRFTAVSKACGLEESMRSIKEMSQASLEKIWADPNHVHVVASYLDEFEEFCGAVHAGVTDKEYAYTLECTRVVRAWTVFEPFILAARGKDKFTRCYVELERLGSEWIERRGQEIKQRNTAVGVRNHVEGQGEKR